MAKYWDAKYFVENKSLDFIGEWIPQSMKELVKKHGRAERIHIILMPSDKDKNKFNCGIHYPMEKETKEYGGE